MINTGKTLRAKRIFTNGKAVIFAPVHHLTSVNPFPGQIDVKKAVGQASAGGATAIVISKGFLKICAPTWNKEVGVINYLCTYAALSPKPIQQIAISSVEESAMLGADGVCVFVGFSTEDDSDVLDFLGKVGNECEKYGLIFIAEAEYPDFYHPQDEHKKKYGVKYLKYTARVCAELGCDVVSTNWTGDIESFKELVDYVKIPVLLNGGPKMDEKCFLNMVDDSIKAGASGCLVGRNLSEAEDTEKLTKSVSSIIMKNLSVKDIISDS